MTQYYESKTLIYGVGSQSLVLLEALGINTSACITLNDYDILNKVKDLENNCVAIGKGNIDKWLVNQPLKYQFIIAIGNHYGKVRVEKQRLLESYGHLAKNVIHNTSTQLSGSVLGKGVQILANSFLGIDCKVGDSVILNSSSSIDHECIIGEGTHIGPNATLTGRVNIGRNVFVGAGSTIIPDVTISDNIVIGAGSVVCNNLIVPGTYIGSPAKKIK
jgi:sugar O-acyltransferase (sialic acid O-acetyltransferase NeuD family)